MYDFPDTPKEVVVEAPRRQGKPVDVSRLAIRVRKAKWALGISVVLGGIVGVTVGKFDAPIEYESHATLVWEPDESETADRARAEKTLLDTIGVPTALAEIRQKLDLPVTLEQLKKRLDVTTTAQSNVLVLSAKGE